jgi:ATP-binding cassette, subfamily B, bacterial HlyB/CyaB
MRELESIRQFLTGQGLFSALDLLFAFIFIAVLLAYSWKLTFIVVASIPSISPSLPRYARRCATY